MVRTRTGTTPRRRRRDAVARPHLVRVRLSDEEYTRIAGRAEVVGLTVPGYLATRGQEDIGSPARGPAGPRMTGAQMRALVAELYALKRILRAAGNNLNQCAKVANATGGTPAEAWHNADLIGRSVPRLERFVESLRGWVEP
jgi:hypothetical protein